MFIDETSLAGQYVSLEPLSENHIESLKEAFFHGDARVINSDRNITRKL